MTEQLSHAAGRQAAGKLFYVGERNWAYGEAEACCARVAGWAEQNGLAPGSVVLVAISDPGVMSVVILGLLRAGLAAALIDPLSTSAEAAQMAAQAAPEAAVVDRELISRWAIGTLIGARLVLPIDAATAPSSLASRLLGGLRKSEKTDALAGFGDCPRPPPAAVDPAATAYIVFTSGTTVRPKGVAVSYGALLSHLATLRRQFDHDEDSRILNVLPLSHADGLVQGPLLAYYCGAALHRPVQFSPASVDALLTAIYAQRITHFIAVPTLLAMILRLASRELNDVFQGGDFKSVTSAAAHLEDELWRRFEQRYRVVVANLYGLTETVTGGVFNGPGAATRRVGTLGKAVDCAVRIVDADGQDLADGEVGELLIAGPSLMTGYVGDPQASAEVLRDGWLHTGDLVRRDAEGFLHYAGRRKSLIICGGLNIQPEEVAEVLGRHAAVVEAAVVGEADAELGEVAVALVVVRGECDASELIAHCRLSLSEYKLPRRIVFTERIPRGRSGKAILGEVQALLAAPRLSESGGRGRTDRLLALAAEVFRVPVESLSLDSAPTNTPGWDSLAHLMLAASLEKTFALALSPAEIVGIASLADALALTAAKVPAE